MLSVAAGFSLRVTVDLVSANISRLFMFTFDKFLK